MPTPKTVDVMVDLETLGRRPGCAILSIGAVYFNPATGELGDTFYVAVRNDGSQEKLGLHVDPDTLRWWESQGAAARGVFAEAQSRTKSKQVGRALDMLNEFLAPPGKRQVRLWGNGSDFDNAILAVAMAAAKRELAWEFWNNRCFRTLKNLVRVPEPERAGTHHNALDDAVHQARHALAILAELRKGAP